MPRKTVLITGCSDGGIGAALAAEFQLRGHHVFATARDPAKMAGLAALGIETLALDVTSSTSIVHAVTCVRDSIPDRLDLLINNAGIHHIQPLSDATIADLQRVLDTNVIGSLAVTQAFIPLMMRDEGRGVGRGVVVMLGSVNEVFAPPYQCAYTASKAAVHAIARTLRVELKPLGISCVTLMTGSVRSRLFENAPTTVPAQSLYGAVAREIEERDILKAAWWVEAEVFAREVVEELVRERPRLDIWRGGMAWVAYLLGWFGWEGMLVSTTISFYTLLCGSVCYT
ncbi:short-chain dehydrogenase/reductase [Xylaria nigripes]|nr:short-chain dehydrogenase/reductase [Xylaria nigripes]